MRTAILVAFFASMGIARPEPGLPFLLIWPTARSTALAGAMTGLADDPDAAFFNPAGLAFQSGLGATAGYGSWLSGFYPDMHFGYLGLVFRPTVGSTKTRDCLAIGLDATCLNLSDSYDRNYELDGPYPDVRRSAVGVTVALAVTGQLSVAAKAKLVRSYLATSLGWRSMPELGIETGGTGSTWAGDVGLLWKPSDRFSLGGGAANLGPGISYPDWMSHDPAPMMLRIGACWTALSSGRVRMRVLPEFDKVLVGMFSDAGNTRTFGQELRAELRDAWKALAVEVSGFELVTVRIGYFEDLSWHRGGIVFERDGVDYQHNLYDLLTRRRLGELRSIGLCWGFGIGYKDYFRVDVSSDAAIYDFDTSNWKLSLVANDIAGGIRELKQGHRPWED